MTKLVYHGAQEKEVAPGVTKVIVGLFQEIVVGDSITVDARIERIKSEHRALAERNGNTIWLEPYISHRIEDYLDFEI